MIIFCLTVKREVKQEAHHQQQKLHNHSLMDFFLVSWFSTHFILIFPVTKWIFTPYDKQNSFWNINIQPVATINTQVYRESDQNR